MELYYKLIPPKSSPTQRKLPQHLLKWNPLTKQVEQKLRKKHKKTRKKHEKNYTED